MSKKFKKLMLFTVAAAAGSALIYWNKTRKAAEEPLFEDEDSCICTPDTAPKTSSATSSSVPDNSRSYINLV